MTTQETATRDELRWATEEAKAKLGRQLLGVLMYLRIELSHATTAINKKCGVYYENYSDETRADAKARIEELLADLSTSVLDTSGIDLAKLVRESQDEGELTGDERALIEDQLREWVRDFLPGAAK